MRSTLIVLAVLLTLALAGRPQSAQTGPLKTKPAEVSEVAGKSLSEWIAVLNSKDPAQKQTAIQNLILFGRRAREAGPALIAAIGDNDASVRVNACITLTLVGANAEDVDKAVTALLRRLTANDQTIVRFHACLALGALGDASKPAIPLLIDQSKSALTWELRRAAVFALGRAGSDEHRVPEKRVVSALLERIRGDICGQVRMEGVLSLGRVGLPAQESDQREVKQAFRQRADSDHDKTVVVWALVGLMAMDEKSSDAHLSKIAQLLRDPEATVRLQAAKALGSLGPKAKDHISDLIQTLGDRQPVVAGAAAWALGSMGSAAARANIALGELAAQKDVEENVRQAALTAIKMINEGGKKPGGKP